MPGYLPAAKEGNPSFPSNFTSIPCGFVDFPSFAEASGYRESERRATSDNGSPRRSAYARVFACGEGGKSVVSGQFHLHPMLIRGFPLLH